MSTYRKIHGRSIQAVTTDPTGDITEGQIWYNTTSETFKTVLLSEGWASGGNLITGRQGVGGAGTQDSGLAISGRTYPSPYVTNTEEYNGSGWAVGGAVSTARIYAATSKNGTQTACFIASGTTPSPPLTSTTEEYNGTSWTSNGAVNTARGNTIGFGTLTAGVMCGGSADTDATEEYNGSSWTTVNNLGTARVAHGGSGLETAGLIFGGNDPSPAAIATTEEYDGTNWTAGGDMNTARAYVTGFGIQSNSIANGGGYPSASNTIKTEGYDGTSWSNKPNSANTRWATDSGWGASGSAGGVSGALANSPLTNVSATEEFTSSANVITGASWASGGSASNSARTRALAGTQTAAFMSGGYIGANSQTRATEHYDGSSWTSGGDLSPQGNPDGGTYGGSACGTQTAGLFVGGSSQGSTDYYFNTSYEYDGSSWASPATFTSPGLAYLNTFGTQTAAVTGGGTRPGQPYVRNYEYDGSSWSSAEDLPVGRASGASAGTLTAGLIFGGYNPSVSPPSLTTSKHYDGTNWTAGGNMVFANNGGGGNGTQTAALSVKGYDGSADIAGCQIYNGTTWVTTATAATAAASLRNGAGTTSAALSAGGSPSTVEEFTGESSALNVKTLTQS